MYLSRCGLTRMMRTSAMGVFLFALSACFPTSQYPIAGAPLENLSDTFSGIWEGTLGDSLVTVLFIQQGQDDTDTHHIGGLIVAHHAERLSLNEGWLEFGAEVSVVSGEIFLSARLKQMDGQPTEADEQGYYLFRVLLEETSMTLSRMDNMVTAELVERSALQGTVDHSGRVPSVELTSDGQDLRAFFMTADLDEVFSRVYARFTRRR